MTDIVQFKAGEAWIVGDDLHVMTEKGEKIIFRNIQFKRKIIDYGEGTETETTDFSFGGLIREMKDE